MKKLITFSTIVIKCYFWQDLSFIKHAISARNYKSMLISILGKYDNIYIYVFILVLFFNKQKLWRNMRLFFLIQYLKMFCPVLRGKNKLARHKHINITISFHPFRNAFFQCFRQLELVPRNLKIDRISQFLNDFFSQTYNWFSQEVNGIRDCVLIYPPIKRYCLRIWKPSNVKNQF